MKARFCLILFFVTALFCQQSFAQDLPTAPDGFSWSSCTSMKGFFLLPKGWNFLEEQKGDTSACFISKEKINGSTGFKTGISINLLRNIPKKMNRQPSVFAQQFLLVIEKKYKAIKKASDVKGPFTYFIMEYIKDDSSPQTHVWNMLISNDKTGSVHLVTAESPSNLWTQNWPVLNVIVSMLGVDDEV
jgi:hypothetical protein